MLRDELYHELKAKAIEAGLYAANMPVEVGGGGLDTVTWVLYEKELGRTNYALHYSCVGRPSNILLACAGRTARALPAAHGARRAHRVPGDDRTWRRLGSARHEDHAPWPTGGDFVINGTKHFISHADHSDFVILFAATGEESHRARQRASR